MRLRNQTTGRFLDSNAKREIVRLLGSRAIPDIDWLRKVTGRGASAIMAILRETTGLLDLARSIHRAQERTGRTYYAQFPAPIELYVITRIVRPRHVVESGVSSGVSSAHVLLALERNGEGQLHSVDLPQYQRGEKRSRGELSWSIPRGKDSGWAVPERLKRNWDLRKGRSEDILSALVQEVPAIDIFCHDSPEAPEHLAFEFETVRPRLRSGSVVIADNTSVNPDVPRSLARAFSTRAWHRGSSSLVGIRVP